MILDQIVIDTRYRLEERKQQRTLAELERLVSRVEAPRNFQNALQGEEIALIAEIKRASPSKGRLCPDLNVAALVHSYVHGGAAAISVLSEPNFFQGSFADLSIAHKAADLPLLCKDFILDPYQVYEARTYGADAVLLIAAILSPPELTTLINVAQSLGMAALVEVHHQQEVEAALAAGASLIGINNRNLADFSIDLTTTLKLRPLIPSDIVVVSESGINSRADVLSLQKVGVNALLVGEALVTAPDPSAKIQELLGRTEVRVR